jgi:flagellar biosynthesis protein FliP
VIWNALVPRMQPANGDSPMSQQTSTVLDDHNADRCGGIDPLGSSSGRRFITVTLLRLAMLLGMAMSSQVTFAGQSGAEPAAGDASVVERSEPTDELPEYIVESDMSPVASLSSHADDPTDGEANDQTDDQAAGSSLGTDDASWTQLFQPDRLFSSLQLVVTMTVVGLVPALLLMTTSYVRITIVLALLRQAFGMQQLLPAQVTTALAMLCTGLVMWPTWTTVHERAVQPWVAGEPTVDAALLWDEAAAPIRQFMIRQIKGRGNVDDVHLFLRHAVSSGQAYPSSWDEVPLRALLPAFLLSELKTAFLIGFQIYLPFLVIDLVVATITTSMGMFMLPPATVALPLKLLLFLMVDGWHLLVEMLLASF